MLEGKDGRWDTTRLMPGRGASHASLEDDANLCARG